MHYVSTLQQMKYSAHMHTHREGHYILSHTIPAATLHWVCSMYMYMYMRTHTYAMYSVHVHVHSTYAMVLCISPGEIHCQNRQQTNVHGKMEETEREAATH